MEKEVWQKQPQKNNQQTKNSLESKNICGGLYFREVDSNSTMQNQFDLLVLTFIIFHTLGLPVFVKTITANPYFLTNNFSRFSANDMFDSENQFNE